MGCGPWRIIFSVKELEVVVIFISPGYPDHLLLAGPNTESNDQDAQIAFKAIWPD